MLVLSMPATSPLDSTDGFVGCETVLGMKQRGESQFDIRHAVSSQIFYCLPRDPL